MPAIRSLADYLTVTLSTFEKNRYDAVGLSQLYPDYEIIKQQVAGRRQVKRTSSRYETFLRIDAPSSYEASFTNHPLATATHKLFKKVVSDMTKVRVSTTFSDEEVELQGTDAERLIDEVQARLVKLDQEYWEGEENALLTFNGSASPPVMNGVLYWVTNDTAVTGFSPNAGDDPVSGGAGGITAAEESRWPNAVAQFDSITQDDFFDLLSKFLHRVKTKHVVAHPSLAPETPARILYTQEPIQRAVERYLSASNENLGMDAGAYRGAPTFRGIPITIWHAFSSPESTVRPDTAYGQCMLIDWNTFHYVVHNAYDRKMHREKLPNIPGQHVVATETYRLLHCTRRDRNMRMFTSNADLLPDSV